MGMWQDDCRHGNGIMVTLDDIYYEGNFVNNNLSGVLSLSNGDSIQGSFCGVWSEGIKVSGVYQKAVADEQCTSDVDSLISRDKLTYCGIGVHPRLLVHAVEEVRSFCQRLYELVRILFPDLPQADKPLVLTTLGNLDCPDDFLDGAGSAVGAVLVKLSAVQAYVRFVPSLCESGKLKLLQPGSAALLQRGEGRH
ncbi:hypothetical protein HPB51_022475 [Rhipicephalus microplus]|uniref:Uncharacterized protein n=1 Tax=Rhipicephalus microplus TaxID=6941 RepID=A0A9J6DCI8_RHIMP|nr:hypothetical protein HPB51_022475 [Rhipicephalus microplus]